MFDVLRVQVATVVQEKIGAQGPRFGIDLFLSILFVAYLIDRL